MRRDKLLHRLSEGDQLRCLNEAPCLFCGEETKRGYPIEFNGQVLILCYDSHGDGPAACIPCMQRALLFGDIRQFSVAGVDDELSAVCVKCGGEDHAYSAITLDGEIYAEGIGFYPWERSRACRKCMLEVIEKQLWEEK